MLSDDQIKRRRIKLELELKELLKNATTNSFHTITQAYKNATMLDTNEQPNRFVYAWNAMKVQELLKIDLIIEDLVKKLVLALSAYWIANYTNGQRSDAQLVANVVLSNTEFKDMSLFAFCDSLLLMSRQEMPCHYELHGLRLPQLYKNFRAYLDKCQKEEAKRTAQQLALD